MHDLLMGGSRAEEVTRSCELAWQQFGRLDENGHLFLREDSRQEGQPPEPLQGCVARRAAEHVEPGFVRTHYPAHVRDVLVHGDDGLISTRPTGSGESAGARMDLGVGDHGWMAA
jgi:hypothetical protein